MGARQKILHATKWAGSITLLAGILIFGYGLFSGLLPVIGIGIGTVTGAVMVFLIGMFFIATDEMLDNTVRGNEISRKRIRKHLYVIEGSKKGDI